VRLVPAWHTNTTPDGTTIGPVAGLVVEIGGQTVYHLGDTALFSDLSLVGRRTPVDVALVPIGGHFTMDRHDAAVACELIGARIVIPCHYDTFPKIAADAEAFRTEVESQTSSRVEILAPGESWSS
jgi:L-ascorbate metabolism protein UlaG (beta-lactamase superfamily)